MKKLIYTLALVIILNSAFLIQNSKAQWQPDVRLTDNSGTSITSYNNARCIASSSENLHLVWYDSRNGDDEIYYKRSTDGGTNWGDDIRLTETTNYSRYPSVGVNGSSVHVVWQDFRDGNDEIYYKRSTDGGTNWGVDTRLTNSLGNSVYPSLSVSGVFVYVVWQDNRDGVNSEIYFKRSTDGGLSWGADIRLTNNLASSWNPCISVSGLNLHVVWNENRDGTNEGYYKRSTDGGVNWGADTRITNNHATYNPSVSVNDSTLLVVWISRPGGGSTFYIYCNRSSDGGVSWGTDIMISSDPAASWYPSVLISGSFAHIVWQDYRDGNYEIYYKQSTDRGLSWGEDTRLTNETNNSGYPFMAVSGSVVHVIWRDNRNGNHEIYYKYNPTGNITGIANISSEIPKEYSLSQNYPNPFNPITKIKFDIPDKLSFQRKLESSYTTLKIFDMLGKEVATLVNQQLQSGIYEVTFDGTNLPSGVFFYRLTASDFTATKRMILAK